MNTSPEIIDPLLKSLVDDALHLPRMAALEARRVRKRNPRPAFNPLPGIVWLLQFRATQAALALLILAAMVEGGALLTGERPSGRNPIAGRVAFWTDDDSSKVNINTAAEGTFWDTPVTVTGKMTDFDKVIAFDATVGGTTDPDSDGFANKDAWQPTQYLRDSRLHWSSVNLATTGEGQAGETASAFDPNQIAEWDLAQRQSEPNEYQKYPGHPASTDLDPALGDAISHTLPNSGTYNTLSGTGWSQFAEYVNQMSPRVGAPVDSASQVLDVVVNGTSGSNLSSLNFTGTNATVTSGSPVTISGTSSITVLSPSLLEKARFFETANSKSPELGGTVINGGTGNRLAGRYNSTNWNGLTSQGQAVPIGDLNGSGTFTGTVTNGIGRIVTGTAGTPATLNSGIAGITFASDGKSPKYDLPGDYYSRGGTARAGTVTINNSGTLAPNGYPAASAGDWDNGPDPDTKKEDKVKDVISSLQLSGTTNGGAKINGDYRLYNTVDQYFYSGTTPPVWQTQLKQPARPYQIKTGAQSGAKPAQAVQPAQVAQPAATPAPIDARKLIRNAALDFEVTSFDKALDTVTSVAGEEQGYVLTQNSEKGANGKLQGQIIVKVLPDHLDRFLLKLRLLGDMKSQTVSGQDVTKDYYDTVSRVRNAEVTEARLIDMMKTRTGKVSDLLEVENEIARVRGEIEQMIGQLKYMDGLVQYATVTITLEEKDLNQAAAFLLKEHAQLSLYAKDVEKAFAEAKSDAADAKAQTLDSQIQRDEEGRVVATLHLLLPPETSDDTIARLKEIGRIQNFTAQTQRVARDDDSGDNDGAASDNAKVDRDKVEINIVIQHDAENPVQGTNISVQTDQVEDKTAQIRKAAADAGIEVKGAEISRARNGVEISAMLLRMPVKKYGDFLEQIKSLGKVKDFTFARREDANATEDAPAEIALRIFSQGSIVESDTGLWVTVRHTIGQGFSALMWSVRMIGVTFAFVGPWLVLAALAWFLGGRRWLLKKK